MIGFIIGVLISYAYYKIVIKPVDNEQNDR